MTDEQKDQILKLHEQGLGYKAIAKTMCIPVGSVTSFFWRLKNSKAKTVCKHCGKTLKQTKGHRQKEFCSERCRYLWRTENPTQRVNKAYFTKTCQFCDKEFVAYGNDTRSFCSRDCYLKAEKGDSMSKEENQKIEHTEYFNAVNMLMAMRGRGLLSVSEFNKGEKYFAKKYCIKKNSIFRPNDLI